MAALFRLEGKNRLGGNSLMEASHKTLNDLAVPGARLSLPPLAPWTHDGVEERRATSDTLQQQRLKVSEGPFLSFSSLPIHHFPFPSFELG